MFRRLLGPFSVSLVSCQQPAVTQPLQAADLRAREGAYTLACALAVPPLLPRVVGLRARDRIDDDEWELGSEHLFGEHGGDPSPLWEDGGARNSSPDGGFTSVFVQGSSRWRSVAVGDAKRPRE